jgi:RimJ/RimL family protein N-acetyltransferase
MALSGKNISLRALEAEDARPYHEWINDPATNQWRGVYHPISNAEALKWIEDKARSAADSLTLAIDTAQGEFVGIIGLRGICSRSRRAEIWIYLGAKDQWGRGIGADAIGTLCRYAFEQMNLHRIWLESDPANTAAVRCYEKNGFVKEGTFKDGYFRHGSYRDTIVMGLVRTDWEGRQCP